MLKLIKCEFYKFKRRSLFVLATLVALVFPVVMTALYWNIPTQVNYDNLFSGIVDYGDFLLLLPILVVIATSLFFTETDNDTLKNLTTIPISKSKIVVAKIGVMAIISVAYTLLGFFASVLCSKILGIAMENMAQKFVLSIGLGIMLLAAALPCVALVVWFNKSDLISIVITLFYTIINYVIHFIRCFNDVSYAYIIIDNNFYSTKRNFSYPFISKKEKNRKEDCKMKKLIPLFLMLCCLVSVTACSKDEIVSNYNQALQSIGDKGLTDDKDLQGKREFGIDSYVGNYTADYDDFSGNEIIFGGTALERDNGNKIEISCDIAAQTGNLKLILQTGTDEPKILCDTESSYNDTIELPSASNYVLIEADNFTGSLKLKLK